MGLKLTSKENVKSLLGESSTTYDTLLDALIEQASAWIENYCNRRFAFEEVADEIYDGNGQHYLYLNRRPVSVVSSVEYLTGSVTNPTWQALDALYWKLDTRKDAIYFEGYNARGTMNYQISYEGGYLIDWENQTDPEKHNLPADLQMACEKLVTNYFNMRNSGGKQSESLEGASVTWKDAMAKDKDTAELLSAYRIIDF
jgi:hypothetical protein